MEKFKKLHISEKLLRTIQEANFEQPTEIQEKTIPLVMEGKDVLGSSATGSGKTLAFGAGIIEKAKPGKGIQALILTPTRELTEQVATTLRKFARYFELTVTEIYGGVDIKPQISALEETEIVVGTPGRILDHLNRRTLDLRGVQFLVLDEADKMLDMGFIEDVRTIIGYCPKERQTLLFSATISPDIEVMADRYMKNPVVVSVESYVDPSKLTQVFYDVPNNSKFSLLVHLLKEEKSKLVMVFCNTRRNVDMLSRNLERYDINALAIHGGLTQSRRTSIMKTFHSNKVQVLICTDVAARGLDIKDVSHVYNYDIPGTAKEYIHRIGRTARAGKEGTAISLVSQRDYNNLRNVAEDHSLKIDFAPLPHMEDLSVNFRENAFRDRPNYREIRRGIRGRRDSDSGGQRRSSGGGSRRFGSGGSRGSSYGSSRGGSSYGGRGDRRSSSGGSGGGSRRSFGSSRSSSMRRRF